MSRGRLAAVAVLWPALLLVLAGCGGYRLDVVAIESVSSDLRFVSPDQVPAGARRLADVRITVHRDPESLAETQVASVRTDRDGVARLDVGAFGAGWMIEQWRLEAMHPDHRTAMIVAPLPRADAGRILLVELAEGRSVTPGRADPLDDYRRFR